MSVLGRLAPPATTPGRARSYHRVIYAVGAVVFMALLWPTTAWTALLIPGEWTDEKKSDA